MFLQVNSSSKILVVKQNNEYFVNWRCNFHGLEWNRRAFEICMFIYNLTATWLSQLGERQSGEWEVVGSNPGHTNTQGLKITEKKVLPL